MRGVLLPRSIVACVLLLGLGGCAGDRTESSAAFPDPQSPSSAASSASSASSASAGAPTTHDNVVATRDYSRWLLHAVPMPRGAREWHHSPTSHYRHGTVGIGPSDGAFTRTTWWTVPLSSDAFGSWLRGHAPPGLRAQDGGGSVQARGVWEQDVDFIAPSTPAHTRAWVNFAFVAQDHELVVRVDTFVGARFARTVLVPDDTTSVTIRRTRRWLAPPRREHAKERTVTDLGAVARLVRMVNRLPGAITTEFVASCPEAVEQRSYTMTFAGPQGSYVASLPTTMCWPSLTLLRDGVAAGPPLDPGRAFARTADRLLG